MDKIIYEPHPVTAKRKAELRASGYKIIDAIFSPADYVHPDAKPARQPRKVVSDDSAE